MNTPALPAPINDLLEGLLANHFSTFETRILTWYTYMMVHSKGRGGKYFCSLDFQVKNVSNLLAASFGIVFVERCKLNTDVSEVYNAKRRPALTGSTDRRVPGRTG